MHIKHVAIPVIFSIVSVTTPAQATMDKELAMQAAKEGHHAKAIQLFNQYQSSLNPDDHEALMQAGIWLGLAQAAQPGNHPQAAATLLAALCKGLPQPFIEQAQLDCNTKPANLITSDLNADMLASGLAMLATQQLKLDEVEKSYRYLSVANKVLLEPSSNIKHAQRAVSAPGGNKKGGTNSGQPVDTFEQLMASLDTEEQNNQQQLMNEMLAGSKDGLAPNGPAIKKMQKLTMRKQIAAMLKSGACQPQMKPVVMQRLNQMAPSIQQQTGDDLSEFISQATNLAEKIDPQKDCGPHASHTTKRKTRGRPSKALDEHKTFSRFVKKQLCQFEKLNTDVNMSSIVDSIASSFAAGMEAKRGTAMKQFNIARESSIDRLTAYYQTVEKLEAGFNQRQKRHSLRATIASCGEKNHLLSKLQTSVLSLLSRGEQRLEYYEKVVSFTLYLQDRKADSTLLHHYSLISMRKLMAQRYVRANQNHKAAQQYQEIAKLIRQSKPSRQEFAVLPLASALISYAEFVKHTGSAIDDVITLANIVAEKQNAVAERATKVAAMNKQERMQFETQELVADADLNQTINQLDINSMLAETGIALPADTMAEMNAAFGNIQEQVGALLSPESIAKRLPDIQAELEASQLQGTFSLDIAGTQIENLWNMLNQQRQFQLQMAQAYITIDRLEEAQHWLQQSPYGEAEAQYRYTSKVLAIENYVTGLYQQALKQPTLASQNFRNAIEHWYFNPINALDILTDVFPSNTFLLEQAAQHEIQQGDPATAFTYIEIARQANLGNPRLYGHLGAEKLEQLQKTLEQEYSQLVAQANNNAMANDQQAAYNQALAQSNKQRTGSARGAMGPLLPLYTGLDPVLPWLESNHYHGFMKRMEIFQALYSNRGLSAYRSNLLVNEKQRQITQAKKQQATHDVVQLAKSDVGQTFDALFRSSAQATDEKISGSNLLASNKNTHWLAIDTINEHRNTLNPDTAFLSYWLNKQNLYVFAVNRDRIQANIIPLKDIHQAIADLNRAYDATIAKTLYQQLIKPYEAMLRTHLVIMTNGALQNIPFAALPYGGQNTYLGDQYLIRYAPGIEYALTPNAQPALQNAATNTATNKVSNKPNNKLLILAPTEVSGAARLQAAKAEANAIAPLFQTDTFFDKQVTRSLLNEKVPQYSLLHYAGHAKLDEDMPDFSHLVLAKDSSGQSSFYINDIKKLPLKNLQLAVLSACESAKTNAFNLNNEFSALNGAFLEAGAASVVASLHAVEDKVTASFMKHFYQKLKNGESKARALQLAQQYVRKNHSTNPKDWAAFILSGQEGHL